MEREIVPQIFSIEREAGERLHEYAYFSTQSEVPYGFYDASRMIHNYQDPILSISETTNLLLGGVFDSTQQALSALKYAEAMSAIKTSDYRSAFDGSEEVLRAYKNRARIAIYDAIDVEGDDLETILAMVKVEEYFEDPLNVVKFNHFYSELFSDNKLLM